MKYDAKVKEEAVKAVQAGKSLKEIQMTLGPNPKAVMRYLAAQGIDYGKMRESLKEKGLLQPAVRKQGEKAKVVVKKEVLKH